MRKSNFLTQLSVLTVKNLLLIKQNLVGTFFELLLSILFVFLLLIIRNYIEIVKYPTQSYSAYTVLDFFYKYAGQDFIYFYPNTPIVKDVITRAVRFIKSQKYWLNVSGNIIEFNYIQNI